MKKILLTLLILVVVVVAGGLYYLYSNINNMIVDAVETHAPPITKTDVTLDSSNVSFMSGEGSMSGLTIGNPKGYSSRKLFKLNNIKVAIDLESITKDVIVIKHVDVVTPELTYEQGGKAGSNVQKLVNNIQSSTAEKSGKKGSKKSTGGGAGESEKKIIIDRLTIRNGKINATMPVLKQWVQVALPTITMKDIGRKKGGATLDEVMKVIMNRVTAVAKNAASGPLKALKKKVLKEVESKVKDKVGKKLGKELKGVGGKVGDKLKKLF